MGVNRPGRGALEGQGRIVGVFSLSWQMEGVRPNARLMGAEGTRRKGGLKDSLDLRDKGEKNERE